MDKPPSLDEIHSALAALREPLERELDHLRDTEERLRRTAAPSPQAEGDLRTLANEYRRRVRRHQERLEVIPQSVFRTVVVRDQKSRALMALALARADSALPAALSIRGWKVHVVPASWHLQRCRAGDVVPLGMVVSVDGQPLITRAECARSLAIYLERKLTARAQRRLERARRAEQYDRCQRDRKQRADENAERIERERREREARAHARKKREEEEEAQRAELRLARVLATEREERVKWESLRRARMERTSVPDSVADDAAEPVAHDSAEPDEAAEHVTQPMRDPVPTIPPIAGPEPSPLRRQRWTPEQVFLVGMVFCLGSLAGCFIAPYYFSGFGFLALIATAALRFALGRRDRQ